MNSKSTDFRPGDLRLLYQTEWWVDKYGQEHRLEDMNPHHRACLIPFLRKRAHRYQWAVELEYLTGLGAVENPSDGVWAAQMAAESELRLPSLEWLEMQPLMVRLRQYEAERTALDRAATKIRNRTWPIRKRIFGAS